METLRDLDLVRGLPAQRRPCGLEARADSGQGDGKGQASTGLGLLTVRFSPFNVWYEVNSWWEGNFLERTVRGAFSKTMDENRDTIRALFQHGYDPIIGSKPISPVDDLYEAADSAVLEGELFDTSWNRDLEPGLRAGVYGSSFRFRVIREEWNDEPGASDYNPKGIPERTLTEVRLFEAGPVTFGASPTATASLRSVISLTDQYYRDASQDNPGVQELLTRARALRDPSHAGKPPARHRGAAQLEPGEPGNHSRGYGPADRRALIHRLRLKESA